MLAGSPKMSLGQEESICAKVLVAEIHSAITTSKRLSVLKKLSSELASLNDDNLSKYCLDFVHYGGMFALMLQINSLLHRSISISSEHKLLCQCIDEILKQLPPDHMLNLTRMENFVFLLVEMLANFFIVTDDLPSDNMIDLQDGVRSDLPQSIMSILHTVSCTAKGSTLVYCNQSSMELIVKVLSKSYLTIDFEAAHEALGVLKNLTYYEEGSRKNLLQLEGLPLALTNLPLQLRLHANRFPAASNSQIKGECDDFTSPRAIMKSLLVRLSAVIRNLSLSTECRRMLAGNPSCLNCIIEILVLAEESISLADISFVTTVSRNVFNILVNLAVDSKELALIILLHNDGAFVRLLANYIGGGTQNKNHKTPLSSLHDPVVRKRSIRVIRLCINLSTARLLLHNASLMTAITDAALLDDSLAVRTEATEAFSRLARILVILPPEEKVCCERTNVSRETLLDVLTELFLTASNPQKSERSVSFATLARAFKDLASNTQYRISIVNRIDLVRQAATIATMSQATTSNTSAIDDICEAFMYLSIESVNQKILCRTPEVLDVLIEASNPILDLHPTTRDEMLRTNSVKAIINLASEEENLSILAEQPGILQRLIQFTNTAHAESENVHPNGQHQFKLGKEGIKRIAFKIVTAL